MAIDYKQKLSELLLTTAKQNASDLHLAAGYPPIISINGELWAIPKEPNLSARDSQGLAFAMMTPEQQAKNKQFFEDFLKTHAPSMEIKKL